MDNNAVVEFLLDCFKYDFGNQLVGAIWYGSRAPDGDIDMMVVHNAPVSMSNLNIGKLDIVSICEGELTVLANLFDPIATEPLINGESIIVNGFILDIKNQLMQSRPNDNIIEHLKGQRDNAITACELFISSISINTFGCNIIKSAMASISFAYGYHNLMTYYRNNRDSEPITIEELCKSNKELNDILILTKKIKRSEECISKQGMMALVNKLKLSCI